MRLHRNNVLVLLFGLLLIPGVLAQVQTSATKTPGPSYNELGQMMVLEYHLIGYPEERWRRTPENFRKDLEMLYENNYYPISVMDMVKREINIPAGKTPFVMTFDDSSQGQFRFLVKDGQTVVDPDCAVGIMEDFKKKHPDFPLTATFYVLPAIKKGLRLFGQEEYIQQKFDYLVQHGYDIGNHSYWHQNLGKTDDKGVQEQLALAVKAIQSYLPGYQVRSMALPLGVHPLNRALEMEGEHNGIKYKHEAVLLVGSGLTVPPYAASFDPQRINRVQAGDSPWGPAAFMKQMKKNPSTLYVSDGEPGTISIPKSLQEKLDPQIAKKKRVRLLE